MERDNDLYLFLYFKFSFTQTCHFNSFISNYFLYIILTNVSFQDVKFNLFYIRLNFLYFFNFKNLKIIYGENIFLSKRLSVLPEMEKI